MLGQLNIPQTISISYGLAEKDRPLEYATVLCDMFAQLGARGVSCCIFGTLDPTDSTATAELKYYRRARTRPRRSYRRTMSILSFAFIVFPNPFSLQAHQVFQIHRGFAHPSSGLFLHRFRHGPLSVLSRILSSSDSFRPLTILFDFVVISYHIIYTI